MSKAKMSDEAKVVVYFESAPLETATMILGVCAGIVKRRQSNTPAERVVAGLELPPMKRRKRRTKAELIAAKAKEAGTVAAELARAGD